MLKQASITLAANAKVVTSIARTEASLQALDDKMPDSCAHHMLALDWHDPVHFLNTIAQHVAQIGTPELTLAWLHDDSVGPMLAQTVAQANLDPDSPYHFFQVRGSAAAAPSQNLDALFTGIELPSNLRYHQIILGYVREGDRSRWLTHDEISQGVLDAIQGDRDVAIVGTVEPWHLRP